MRLLERADELRRESGVGYVLVQGFVHLYNQYVWPRLPETDRLVMNGVAVAGVRPARGRIADPEVVEYHRMFDDVVPWKTPSNCDDPEYEHALIAAIRERVEAGQNVVIVGGGAGVSTVIAAERTGLSGSVETYEAMSESAELVGRTVALNGLEDRCMVHNKVVGSVVDDFGTPDAEEQVPPEELPDADVLVLDCEGAEREILTDLSTYPTTIIVETHGMYDVPPEVVEKLLDAANYEVVNRTVEDAAKGIVILTAERA